MQDDDSAGTAMRLLDVNILLTCSAFIIGLGILLVSWLGSLSTEAKLEIGAGGLALAIGASVMLSMHRRAEVRQRREAFESRPPLPSRTPLP